MIKSKFSKHNSGYLKMKLCNDNFLASLPILSVWNFSSKSVWDADFDVCWMGNKLKQPQWIKEREANTVNGKIVQIDISPVSYFFPIQVNIGSILAITDASFMTLNLHLKCPIVPYWKTGTLIHWNIRLPWRFRVCHLKLQLSQMRLFNQTYTELSSIEFLVDCGWAEITVAQYQFWASIYN